MKKIIISLFLAVAFVISIIPCRVYAESSQTLAETNEINRLINQLKSGGVSVTDGYNNYSMSLNLKNNITIAHSFDDGKKLAILTAEYDPANINQEIEVHYDLFIGREGVTAVGKTNITDNDYCSNNNCIPFIISASFYMSKDDEEYYKNLAGMSFQLLISTLRLELAQKYQIDLSLCGFRSISSLIPEKQNNNNPFGNVKPFISTAKNKKGKKLFLMWDGSSIAKGYQIQYSTNKKFKKTKSRSVKKTCITLKKLKKRKTYYVRVRAYGINSSGEKVYSKWSKVRKVKIRK